MGVSYIVMSYVWNSKFVFVNTVVCTEMYLWCAVIYTPFLSKSRAWFIEYSGEFLQIACIILTKQPCWIDLVITECFRKDLDEEAQ